MNNTNMQYDHLFYYSFTGFLIYWFPSPLVRPPVGLVKDPSHGRTASVRLPPEFLCRRAHLFLAGLLSSASQSGVWSNHFPHFTPYVSLRCTGGL
jgi:hypothetical protein